MAPKFEEGKWIATEAEDGPEAGYPAVQTLLMHGPKPWFTRVFQPDDYEQAVLKFMVQDKVGRVQAMGNMDCYLRNPQDWTFNRFEEDKRGIKYDYWTFKPGEAVKVVVWSVVVVSFFGRFAYSLATGDDFYTFGPFIGSH